MQRVLVVEDDANQSRALAIGLRLEGFEVTTMCDAEAALALFETTTFDAAIVDLMLPGVNGIELARQMRRLDPATRVVLTSAYHLNEQQLRRADCGVIGFLPKPYALGELAEFLRVKIATAPESMRNVAASLRETAR
ncbi:MAG: response regulator [Polyangiaceae bacterium]